MTTNRLNKCISHCSVGIPIQKFCLFREREKPLLKYLFDELTATLRLSCATRKQPWT